MVMKMPKLVLKGTPLQVESLESTLSQISWDFKHFKPPFISLEELNVMDKSPVKKFRIVYRIEDKDEDECYYVKKNVTINAFVIDSAELPYYLVKISMIPEYIRDHSIGILPYWLKDKKELVLMSPEWETPYHFIKWTRGRWLCNQEHNCWEYHEQE